MRRQTAALTGVMAALVLTGTAEAAGSSGLIAFNYYENFQVWTVKPDGSSERRLRRSGYDAAWSPNGTRIVFVRDVRTRGGGGRNADLFLARADGSHMRRLTRRPSDELEPSFSPDGRRIVFVSDGDLQVANRRGKQRRSLTDLPGDELHPGWSVHDEIVFGNEGIIYRIDAAGAAAAVALGGGRDPAWSPDGQTIAFVEEVILPGPQGLTYAGAPVYTMDRTGAGRTAHTPADPMQAYSFSDPAFSPNGASIVAAAHQGSFHYMLLQRLDLASGKLTDLAAPYCCDADPDWQPR